MARSKASVLSRTRQALCPREPRDALPTVSQAVLCACVLVHAGVSRNGPSLRLRAACHLQGEAAQGVLCAPHARDLTAEGRRRKALSKQGRLG